MSFEPFDRKRARKARDFVLDAAGPDFSKYHSLVRGFPSRIQTAGIGQSVAFLLSKSKNRDEHTLLLGQLEEWLLKESFVPWKAEDSALLDRLLESEPNVWWVAEREATALLAWMKRFADASNEAALVEEVEREDEHERGTQ